MTSLLLMSIRLAIFIKISLKKGFYGALMLPKKVDIETKLPY